MGDVCPKAQDGEENSAPATESSQEIRKVPSFGDLSPEDRNAIIEYFRTLKEWRDQQTDDSNNR